MSSRRGRGWLAVTALVAAVLVGCGASDERSAGTSTSASPARVLGSDDHLILPIAGSPAFRVTGQEGTKHLRWDLWTIPADGPPVWTATLPAFMGADVVRTDGATYLVGARCASEDCETGDSLISVELTEGAPVTVLPVDGPFGAESSFQVDQVQGADPALLVFSDGDHPDSQLVEFTPPEGWTVTGTIPDGGRGVWCRVGDQTFVAGRAAGPSSGVVELPLKNESESVEEFVDGAYRTVGQILRPGAAQLFCLRDGFVAGQDNKVVGSWTPAAGWVPSGTEIAPTNTQVRWLDQGALWVDDTGMLEMWNGTLHHVGHLDLSATDLAKHAEAQSKPLGSEPTILGLSGDIDGDHVHACAAWSSRAYDTCQVSA